jgi:hypothetical protein
LYLCSAWRQAEPWNAQNFPCTPAARAATAARNDWPSMQGESRQTERDHADLHVPADQGRLGVADGPADGPGSAA